MRQMLATAFSLDQPAAVRYPRGSGPGAAIMKEMSPLPLARNRAPACSRRPGSVAILAFGSLVKPRSRRAPTSMPPWSTCAS